MKTILFPVHGVALALLGWVRMACAAAGGPVTVESLPEAGLQPQAIAENDGTVHLVYLKGPPGASDVVYRRRSGEGAWSAPLRVNSQPGSAIAVGTIRGAHFALGRNGRVHVIWNGSQTAAPKPPAGGMPMLYARLTDDATGFSPQRNLMTATHELDGGGSVGADSQGRVFVVWQASRAGVSGETNRAVFVASSTDDGATFAPERAVSPEGMGACGCCGLTAWAGPKGEVFVLFRAARTAMQRDMTLLVSNDGGGSFKETFAHPWAVGMCPMSSAALLGGGATTLAAWETAGRVYLGRFGIGAGKPEVREVGPASGAKHPRLATNARGETLMIWAEGTGWQRGGALAWQHFDARGEPTPEKGRRDGIAAWSYAAVYAKPDGDFVILH